MSIHFDTVTLLAREISNLKTALASYRSCDAGARFELIERAVGELGRSHQQLSSLVDELGARLLALEAYVGGSYTPALEPLVLEPYEYGVVDLYAREEDFEEV